MNIETIKLDQKRIFLFALLTAMFILAYFPVLKKLVLTWMNSDEYSHGFFIIPMSGYLIWRKKEFLKELKPNSSWWGFAPVILSLLIYLFSHVAKINTLASVSMILLLSSSILFFYGFSVLRELAFPIVFLFFMIPVPEQIYSQLTVPLQLFVSKINVWFTAILGIPIFREGNVIHLPDKTMQVAQACSGLRSMISILPLSAILGYLTLRMNFLKYLLFFSGIPAAIIVNIFRVVLLVVAWHYFKLDLATGTIHTIFGMFVFMLAFIIILLVRRILILWDRG